MILTLIDGTETVFLTVILRAVAEDKSVYELMRFYSKSGKLTDALQKMREFAKTKLCHPDLAVVLEEIERLTNPNDEGRKEPKNP